MIDELLKRSISWYRCRSFPLFDCTLPSRFIPQKEPIATRSYHFVSFASILEHTACSSCTRKENTIAWCLRRSNCVKLRNHRFAPRFSAFSLTPGIFWRRHTKWVIQQTCVTCIWDYWRAPSIIPSAESASSVMGSFETCKPIFIKKSRDNDKTCHNVS